MTETSLESAILYGERIRKLIEENPVCADGTCIPITISLGIIHHSQELGKVDFTVLLNKADEALYNSKNSGRNKYSVFNESKSWQL